MFNLPAAAHHAFDTTPAGNEIITEPTTSASICLAWNAITIISGENINTAITMIRSPVKSLPCKIQLVVYNDACYMPGSWRKWKNTMGGWLTYCFYMKFLYNGRSGLLQGRALLAATAQTFALTCGETAMQCVLPVHRQSDPGDSQHTNYFDRCECTQRVTPKYSCMFNAEIFCK